MSPDTLELVCRREYPDTGDGIFLNAASYGLLPRSTVEAVADLTRRRSRCFGFREEELGEILAGCRKSAGRLLDVPPEQIALGPNTSYGVNLATARVAMEPPGTVVVSEGEFPANVLPWKALERHGFRLEVVPARQGLPDEDRLAERLDRDDVRAFALSAVQFGSGHRADLPRFGKLCREREIVFAVDAIQALGAVPLHPLDAGIDLLTAGGQKWLCAPWGSGLTWLHPRLSRGFPPPVVSWLAVEGALDFADTTSYALEWRADARRYELATLGVQDMWGLGRSLEVLMEVGVERIGDHLEALHRPVMAWLEGREGWRLVTPPERERRAGILAFRPPDLPAVTRALDAGGVAFAVREGSVRLSPHLYNTTEEMERVVELLDGASS